MEVIKYLGSKDPILILKNWMKEARSHKNIKEWQAMSLCTVQKNTPRCRTVLAKEITKNGIIFYTNTQSQKGLALLENHLCSCHFYWDLLFKQVIAVGKAKLVSRKQTEKYWKTRPKKSQLSQWISKQSKPIKDRKTLDQEFESAKKKFQKDPIPCPKNWSGYHVKIQSIEFWQGRNHRLHDRFLFSLNKNSTWKIKRLYP